jgi:hypothetical protein
MSDCHVQTAESWPPRHGCAANAASGDIKILHHIHHQNACISFPHFTYT